MKIYVITLCAVIHICIMAQRVITYIYVPTGYKIHAEFMSQSALLSMRC